MPDFVTATLPPTLTPQATQVSTLPAPGATVELNILPVEGTTTTQLNVRAEPSTASASLGMIGPFVKAQVIGKDASGSWYQIIYAESERGKGWVRAEYVQVDAPAEIPLAETTAGSKWGVSGLVIQKVNIRSGPGIEYEALGVLNSGDVVFITGKDAGGAWIQIEFANAPGGTGWVTAEFLRVENIEGAPIIGNAAVETAAPLDAPPTPNTIAILALQDGDSMQAPLAAIVFSAAGSRALQVGSDISAPDGDAEDWIQFTTPGEVVAIQVKCSGGALRMELWKDGKPADDFSSVCGNRAFVTVTPNSSYFLRLLAPGANEPVYINYILSVEDIR